MGSEQRHRDCPQMLFWCYIHFIMARNESISQKWCIPKQTVNTILKDFQKKGYVEMAAMQSDKQNKLLRLTDFGKKLADEVIGKFCQPVSYK